MKWKISEAKGSGINHIGYAESTPITNAVYGLWQKYIAEAARENAKVAWDHLRVEIWLDSGRVILFPTSSPFRHRIEKAMCQIICPDLLDFYETLIESDLSDEKFEPLLISKEHEIAELLSASARELKLPEKLGRSEVKILYYGSDLENPIKEDFLRR